MMFQSKYSQFSQKKTQGRCKTLQTLPSESEVDPHQYDSLFTQNHHSTSIKACEPINTCSSPTFANSQLLSLSEYRLNHKDKENLDDNINWKQQARMYKGANNKLTQSYKELESQNSYLKQMLKSAKDELKSKGEDHIMINLFSKFLNSSENKDHVDIYLQLKSFTEHLKKSQETIKAMRQDLDKKNKQTITLVKKQQQFEQVVQKFEKQVLQLTESNQQYKEKLVKKQNEYQQLKTLKEQVDKQRQVAYKKISELQAEVNVANRSVSEFSKDHQTNFLEIQKHKEQLEKCKEQLEKLSKQNQVLKREKQQFKQMLNDQKKMTESQQEQVKEIKEHNYNLQREVARSISEFEMYKRKVERQLNLNQQTIKNLQSQINEIKQTFQLEKQQREMTEQKSQSLAINHKKTQLELSQLKEQKLSLQKNILSKDQQIQDLKRKLSTVTISFQNISKDVGFYQQKIDMLERDQKSLEQIKNYQIELKQQVIRKLIGFAPNESKDVLEQYLIIIQQLISSENESELRKNKILIEVDHTISNHKDKIKHLEEVSKKYNDLKYQYELLKKSVTNNETRRTEVSLETNRRCKINKYFA